MHEPACMNRPACMLLLLLLLLLLPCACMRACAAAALNSRHGATPRRTPPVHRIYKFTTPPEPPCESGWPKWVPRPPVWARGGTWPPLEGFPGPFPENFGVFGAPGWEKRLRKRLRKRPRNAPRRTPSYSNEPCGCAQWPWAAPCATRVWLCAVTTPDVEEG